MPSLPGELRNDTKSKPASQQADFRSFAANVALREHKSSDFVHMSQLYVGGLLSEGRLFQETESKKVFLSLGFVSQCLLLFETEPVADSQMHNCPEARGPFPRFSTVLISMPLKAEARAPRSLDKVFVRSAET